MGVPFSRADSDARAPWGTLHGNKRSYSAIAPQEHRCARGRGHGAHPAHAATDVVEAEAVRAGRAAGRATAAGRLGTMTCAMLSDEVKEGSGCCAGTRESLSWPAYHQQQRGARTPVVSRPRGEADDGGRVPAACTAPSHEGQVRSRLY